MLLSENQQKLKDRSAKAVASQRRTANVKSTKLESNEKNKFMFACRERKLVIICTGRHFIQIKACVNHLNM